MTSGDKMVIYWGRGLEVFLKPLSKCSCRLSYVFFITFHPVTFVSVYDATLLSHMVFVFGWHQEVFDGPAPFKVYFYAMFLQWDNICQNLWHNICQHNMAITSAIKINLQSVLYKFYMTHKHQYTWVLICKV